MKQDMEFKGTRKVKHFIWKAYFDGLTKKVNLKKRKKLLDDICHFFFPNNQNSPSMLIGIVKVLNLYARSTLPLGQLGHCLRPPNIKGPEILE